VTALLQRRKFCRADSVCDLCDVYFYSHFHVDAEGSIPLTHGLGYVIYGLTLNNDVGFYQASPQYMIRREYYRLAVAAGFRWSPTFGKYSFDGERLAMAEASPTVAGNT
jgi:hypothetical protein